MASLFARIAAFVLGTFAFASVHAQTYTYTFYVGNTNAPGCTITTSAGPVDHVKWRLQATVTAGVAPQFGSVTRADCNNGVFGSASPVTSTSAVGLNTGIGGADVIEVQLPKNAVGPTPSPKEILAVVASNSSTNDALIATYPSKSDAKGSQSPTPTLIPSLGLGGIILLGLALVAIGWYALRRYAHLLPLSLLLVAGTAWAVAIVIDGQVGDWATITPSTDPSGDVSEPALDLVGLYVTDQGPHAFVRVDVVNLQNPPVANPTSANLLEDGNTTITLTGSDPGGSPLTFQIVTPPSRGSLGAITPINATSASVQYTGNADEFGADSFTFKVNNGTQNSVPATVAVTIAPVNDAPNFTAVDPPTVNEGAGAQTVSAWASFTPGPANESSQVAFEYVVSAVGNPALFAIAPSVATNGTLSYTLAPNANGTSNFTVAVRDDGGIANGGVELSAAQSFTVTVNAVNAAPSFVGGGDASSLEDAGAQVVTGWATAIDDGDPEQTQALTFNVTANTNPALFSAGPSVNPANGDLSYTAAPDANGTAQVTLTLSDDGGTANGGSDTSAPVVFNVQVTAVNDAPSFTAVDPPAVNEGSGAQSVPNWATFDPGPADESSQAVLEYTVSAIGTPTLFTIAPSVATNGTLSYTLAPNVSGTSSFTIAVRDDGGIANGGVDLSAAQNFTITVNAVNSAPTFVGGGDVGSNEDASAQTVAGWATAIDDGDPDQVQTLTFAVTANTNPTLFSAGPTVDPISGDLSYTAAPDANGSAQITLVLSDDGGTANGGNDTSAPYVFNVQVTAVNDAPSFTAVNPPAVNENTGAQTVPNWAAFNPGPADESGQAVLEYTVSAIGNPALFTIAPSVATNGTLSYTLAPNVSGSSSFSVTVRDEGGVANGGVDLSAAQNFTITINSVNSPPTFVGGGDVSAAEDAGAQTVVGWATAIDDGDPEVQTLAFAVTANTNPTLFSAGPAVDAVSGNLTYTPAANASGSATITLQLSDNGGTANGGNDTSAPYNFTITVTPVNDAPTATAKSHVTHSAIELEIVAASHTGELLEGAADSDDPIGDLTAVFVAGSAVPAGAQVAVTNASDGSFRYDPPGGYSGAGSFQFRICDDGIPAAPPQCSAATTVSFTITGPDLYFVDDNAPPGGDGGLNDPFDALTDLPAGRGNNDRIFVFAGSYPTAVHSFFAGEHLVGQGTTGAFDTVLGVVAVANGTLDARPALTGVAGDRPALNRIVMSGAHNAAMRGVALSTASSESVFISGTTGVTVSESSAASSISGVNITNSSASGEGVTFTNVTSTGGVNGIVLNNLTGAFNLGAGSLAGNTGVSFLATGTLGTTTYGGSITKTANGNLVEISGAAAGTVTLSGDFDCSSSCDGIDVLNRGAGTITFSGATKTLNTTASTAVNLDNNDAATIDFTGGGLNIDTTSGIGFNAINGATAITVQGTVNTVDSTTGIALNVANSTIGAAGLTFRSINANGAPSGIVLNTTGANAGLTVTGNSSGACGGSVTVNAAGTPATVGAPVVADCTGGTIQATTAAGIVLNSTRNVSLTRMRVLNPATDGMQINTINGFTLSNSVISDAAGVAGDRGVEMGDFSTGTAVNGAIVVSNSFIGPTPHDNVGVGIGSGTSTWSITGTVFDDSQLNSGFNFQIRNAAVSTFLIDGSVFNSNFADGVRMQPALGVNATIASATIQNSTFTGNNIGLNLNHDGTSSVTYRALSNTVLNQTANSVNVFTSATAGTSGAMNGRFVNNRIGDPTAFNSGGGVGIRVNINGGADATALLDANVVRQVPNGRGFEIISRNGTVGLDATLTNNQVNTDFVPTVANGGFSLANIFMQSNCVPICNTLRSDVRGNTVPPGVPTGELIAGQLVLLRTGASVNQLVDNAPASGDALSELMSHNTGSVATSGTIVLIPGPITTPP